MRASLLALRHAVFGAIGVSVVVGCGGNVTVVDGSGSGGSGATGSTSVTKGASTNGVTTGVTTGSSMNQCVDPKPILNGDGTPTPYAICADGAIDRPGGGSCDPTINHQQCQGTEGFLECMNDSDCTDAPNGHCVHQPSIEVAGDYCGCVYSCATDKECGGTGVCACADIVTGLGYAQCVPNNCMTNGECPSGECGLSTYDDGCSRVVLVACRTSQDICRTTGQCAAGECAPQYIDNQPYGCQTPNCAIGRPLLVEGVARVANTRARSDWGRMEAPMDTLRLSPPEPRRLPGALRPEVREAAAQHYLTIARLEHASIASFSRFALSLMAIGAPAELVRDAQAAAIDEVDHARAAFAIASELAGADLGPDVLRDALAPLSTDLASIVEALVEEGCVGETVGVAEALAIAERATDRALAAHHRKVAADEQRHAELAWRTLQWLLEGDASLRDVARAAFARAIDGMRASVAPSLAAPELGLLGGRAVTAVRREALRLVVEPARDALLRTTDRRAS